MNPEVSTRARTRGYALLLVLVFLGLSIMLLAGIMQWGSENSRNTDRGNEYYTSAAASEAATEKILVRLSRDYINYGEAGVLNNLPGYRTNYPNATDNAYWNNYNFKNPNDGSVGTWAAQSNAASYQVLSGQYSGLSGYRSTYYVSSDASLKNSRYGITARVGQWIGLEAIPLFQFAIFYNMDLEIEPSPPMVVSGRVHSNSNIFVLPTSTLTFSNDVTASGNIITNNMPGDPRGNRGLANEPIGWVGEHTGGNSSLNLPIGTNNSPDNVFEVLKIPPPSEDPSSAMGTNRYYNKADLIIIVSNNTVSVTSGVNVDNKATVIASNQWSQFLTTNSAFYNGREASDVRVTQIDVGKFRTWAQSSNSPLAGKLTGKSYPNIVYVDDARTGSGYEDGVRVINGSELPGNGLTVATPNPIYVQGDFNTTSDGVNFSKGVNSTVNTLPSSLVGDAINVLSGAWKDSNALNQAASDTTVNAAFLGGIVPTSSSSYSGGVENFPRFLENWSGRNFWYNGSMVVMFNSRTEVGDWDTSGYYNPPARHWAFDLNFYVEAKLPPGTPRILFMERLQWAFRDRSAP